MVAKVGIPSGDKSQALDWHGYEVIGLDLTLSDKVH